MASRPDLQISWVNASLRLVSVDPKTSLAFSRGGRANALAVVRRRKNDFTIQKRIESRES
jgi:hypothetical protein